jgi:hypothetical protein
MRSLIWTPICEHFALTKSLRQGLSACEALIAFFSEVARVAREQGIPNCEVFAKVTAE